jgi:hypothetical protein
VEQRQRIPGVGWEIRSAEGRLRSLVRDGGGVLYADDRLVGTQEAAALVGVRAPNFVRDWASRPDFPAPAALLSTGRVWRDWEVADYAARRRRPRPSAERLAAIARRVAWWDEPERTQARPELFIARVLGRGSVPDILDIEAEYGRAQMRRAVQRAPAAVLDERARNYWELMLDLPSEPAPEARTIR